MGDYQLTYMDVLAMQGMDNDQRAEYIQGKQRQQNIQAGVLGAASMFDILQGRRTRRDAEADIEEGAMLRQDVVDKIKDIQARDFSELTPEARRNAAILLKDYQPDDSDELAAAEMALRSGAAPTSVQRTLNEALLREESIDQAREEAAFREGMGYAQRDEQIAIEKLMSDYGLDYQMAQEMIAMGQQQSMMGQQQSGAGWRNLFNAAVRYMGSGGIDKIKGLFNRSAEDAAVEMSNDEKLLEGADYVFSTPSEDPADYTSMFESMREEDFLQSLENAGFAGFEPGGTYTDLENLPAVTGEQGMVIKTPGEFNHDTNPIDVMRNGSKIAEMTGGEFVINPDQAAGMEKAYAKAKKNKSQANLLELFNAVRFIDEPQFD